MTKNNYVEKDQLLLGETVAVREKQMVCLRVLVRKFMEPLRGII